MANNKNATAKPVRSTQYQPKAGPKSKSGGRKRGMNGTNDQLSARAITLTKPVRKTKEEWDAEIYSFQLRQAETARTSEAIASLPDDSVEKTVALAIFDWFPKVTATRMGAVVLKKHTNVAIEVALQDLKVHRSGPVNFGINAARAALTKAYDTISATPLAA